MKKLFFIICLMATGMVAQAQTNTTQTINSKLKLTNVPIANGIDNDSTLVRGFDKIVKKLSKRDFLKSSSTPAMFQAAGNPHDNDDLPAWVDSQLPRDMFYFDNTAGELYTFDYGSSDWIQVGGSSTVPTFQQVSEAGPSTDQPIVFYDGLQVVNPAFPVDGEQIVNVEYDGIRFIPAGVEYTGKLKMPNASNPETVWNLPDTTGNIALIGDMINNGVTALAPTQNAVFDALALKAVDANVIHTTGNETKAGVLTLANTASTVTNGIVLTNSGSTSTGVLSVSSSANGIGILANNFSTGKAIGVGNASVGYGIDLTNTAAGIGMNMTNTSSGKGISITNSNIGNGVRVDNTNAGQGFYAHNTGGGYGIYGDNTGAGYGIGMVNQSTTGDGVRVTNSFGGKGLYAINNSTGVGVQVDNNSTGAGVTIANASTGRGVFITNADSGDAVVVGNIFSGSGRLFVGTDSGVEKFAVTKTGSIFTGNGTDNYFRITHPSADSYSVFDYVATDNSLDNYGSLRIYGTPEEGFSITKNWGDYSQQFYMGSGYNNMHVNDADYSSDVNFYPSYTEFTTNIKAPILELYDNTTTTYANIFSDNNSVIISGSSTGSTAFANNTDYRTTFTSDDNTAPRALNTIDASGYVPVLRTSAPASSTAAGVKGEIYMDATGLYYCYADNLWRKSSGSTF